MTPTRSGSNYSIQSNGSGPGHSIHKSKGQDCQPRGEAQMEDATASTSLQRLARTFDNLIEGPEADISAILAAAGVGTSSKPLDRHNELISSNEEVHGPRKDRGSSEGLDTHVFQRTSPTDKSLSEDQKRKLAQGKGNSPVEDSQASTSKNMPQQVPNKGKQIP
ncbi:hypothetical protein O181_074589 [Austropuccinia psidii MF-1]|uniref:Uncharacterized protein n=1 Tax=Austropuccinia psidii MF-1 TaxID=1389203 RepID=A0A9Q3F9C2_9BASI|nr:hypothetical protein [Austropuccinia psidii MF-1]